MTAFLREQIEKRLKELRDNCALQRETKRNAFNGRWARSARSAEENRRDSGPSDKYWDDLQAKAQRDRTVAVESADKALADFIAEHRALMPADWIGNEHGRLCWSPYLGGYPIDQHYCQREEGHEGHHADEARAWPQGVTCDAEWHRLRESCSLPSTCEHDRALVCTACGKTLAPSRNEPGTNENNT